MILGMKKIVLAVLRKSIVVLLLEMKTAARVLHENKRSAIDYMIEP